jgi:hypothetical protein
MPTEIENPPFADSLVDSMRFIGYSFQSALCDIIDNSISAKANHIDIDFSSDPKDIYLAVIDDGIGMDRDQLYDAMKYGSGNPNLKRDKEDLGRYWMGLKTASLSQCRKLTVISKKDGIYSAFSWDLDIIQKTRKWTIVEFLPNEISSLKDSARLSSYNSGTVVVWQNFDVIARSSKTGELYDNISNELSKAVVRISLVFHRFMQSVTEKVTITNNRREIKPLIPFLEYHKRTEPKAVSQIDVLDENGQKQIITIQPYILPYQKDLTEEDIENLGGIENLNSMQGFYVYRADRLIIYGTWFGMEHKSELAKYSRIKVDIPNTLDSICSIDIKKETAVLPAMVRNKLVRVVSESFSLCKKKYTHRSLIVNSASKGLWEEAENRDNRTVFRINRESPLIEKLRKSLDDAQFAKVEELLFMLEETIPVVDIVVASSSNKVAQERSEEEKSKMINLAKSFRDSLVQIGTPKEEATKKVLNMSDFGFDFIRKAMEEEKQCPKAKE